MSLGKKPRAKTGTLAMKILELIPYNSWITAKEIANHLGTTSSRVGQIILYRLLFKEVETMPIRDESNSLIYLYRRKGKLNL